MMEWEVDDAELADQPLPDLLDRICKQLGFDEAASTRLRERANAFFDEQLFLSTRALLMAATDALLRDHGLIVLWPAVRDLQRRTGLGQAVVVVGSVGPNPVPVLAQPNRTAYERHWCETLGNDAATLVLRDDGRSFDCTTCGTNCLLRSKMDLTRHSQGPTHKVKVLQAQGLVPVAPKSSARKSKAADKLDGDDDPPKSAKQARKRPSAAVVADNEEKSDQLPEEENPVSPPKPPALVDTSKKDDDDEVIFKQAKRPSPDKFVKKERTKGRKKEEEDDDDDDEEEEKPSSSKRSARKIAKTTKPAANNDGDDGDDDDEWDTPKKKKKTTKKLALKASASSNKSKKDDDDWPSTAPHLLRRIEGDPVQYECRWGRTGPKELHPVTALADRYGERILKKVVAFDRSMGVEFEPKAVLDARANGDVCVRWRGYPSLFDSWEDRGVLGHLENELMEAYERGKKKKKLA